MKITDFLQRLLLLGKDIFSNRESITDEEQEELVSFQAYLNEEFEKRNPDLKIPPGMAVLSIKRDEFQSSLHDKIQVFITEMRLDADPYRLALGTKQKNRQERIATLEKNLSNVLAQIGEHLSNPIDTRPPVLYKVLYLLLLGAVCGLAAYTAYLLYHEMGWTFSVISSLVFIGGAFFVYRLHQDTSLEKRKHFRKWVYIIGLVFYGVLAFSFGIGRGTLVEQLKTLDEGVRNLAGNINIFTQEQKAEADHDKKIQLIQFLCACVAFVSNAFMDACLGGSYMIEIVDRSKFLKRFRDLEFAEKKIQRKLRFLRENERLLACQLDVIDHFDDFLHQWASEKEKASIHKLDMQMVQARNHALAMISKLSNAELGMLSSIAEFHFTQQKQKGGFDHVSQPDQEIPIPMGNDGKGHFHFRHQFDDSDRP